MKWTDWLYGIKALVVSGATASLDDYMVVVDGWMAMMR